jgi:hypothetical protein
MLYEINSLSEDVIIAVNGSQLLPEPALQHYHCHDHNPHQNRHCCHRYPNHIFQEFIIAVNGGQLPP